MRRRENTHCRLELNSTDIGWMAVIPSAIMSMLMLLGDENGDTETDGCPRMGNARRAFAPVGRILLFHRRRGQGTAARHHCHAARQPRGNRASHRLPYHGPSPAARMGGVARLFRHGPAQQHHSLLPDRLGPDPDCQRACFDPQCHHAALHRHRRPLPHRRREDDRQQARRRADRLCRGGDHDRPGSFRRIIRPLARSPFSARPSPIPSRAYSAAVSRPWAYRR